MKVISESDDSEELAEAETEPFDPQAARELRTAVAVRRARVFLNFIRRSPYLLRGCALHAVNATETGR
jgi:hypothetical protein